MEYDLSSIKVHPLLEPLLRIFEFYLLGYYFLPQPLFQEITIKEVPAFEPMLKSFNINISHKVSSNGSHTANFKMYQIYLVRMQLIALYDFLEASKYNSKINTLDIYKFCKYLRHGSAHGNLFTFLPKDLNYLGNYRLAWRNKVITPQIQKTEVTPLFITFTEILFLIEDVSAVLFSIDKESKVLEDELQV